MNSELNEQAQATFEHAKLSEKHGQATESCAQAVKSQDQNASHHAELIEE